MGGSDIAGDSPPKGEGSNSRASNTNTGNVARGSGKSELAPAKFPWGAIIALAMGMLVYGVAESYGPVAAISGVIPSSYAFLGLSLPYVAGGFGALLSGYLTDAVGGRRNSFMLTAAMILAGIIIYVLAGTNVAAWWYRLF